MSLLLVPVMDSQGGYLIASRHIVHDEVFATPPQVKEDTNRIAPFQLNQGTHFYNTPIVQT